MNHRSIHARILFPVGLALASFAMSGCVGYSTYPAVQGAYGGKNPNVADLYENAAYAIKWAVQHYPPGNAVAPTTETYAAPSAAPAPTEQQPFAVSFIPGLRNENCLRMVELIGQGAVPLTPETADLPTYMISSVDVVGDSARVTVLRPVGRLSTGEAMHQGISIRLRGGLRRWTVVSHRVWDVATVSTVEPVELPAPGEVPFTGSLLEGGTPPGTPGSPQTPEAPAPVDGEANGAPIGG